MKLTSLSLHSIASKGDDTTLKSVLIEVRVGSNAAKTETVIAKCDYSLTNNTDYVICSCFPSDQDISYLKIVFKRPSEKNSFWGKLSDQIKVKWIHLVGKRVQPATTSKTSVQDAAVRFFLVFYNHKTIHISIILLIRFAGISRWCLLCRSYNRN